MHPTYYRGCWHVVSRCLFIWYLQDYSQIKEVYDPRTFILHAVLLHQTFVHCAKFPTAASRRSMGRVSVPSRLVNLSVQLPVIALVSYYLTNKLIGTRLLPKRPKALPARGGIMQDYPTFRWAILHLGVSSLLLLSRLPLSPYDDRSTCMC